MKRISRLSTLLGLMAAATASLASAASAQLPVKKTLPNGLTVLVRENHAAPVVAVRVYVKTGSITEGQYLGSGISHLFEHALSEGTRSRTKEQINDEVQGIGGQSNAYTTFDVTAYHITTASSYFGRALNSLSDMMQNATFPEAEVKTQIGIIHNEMNLNEDDPDRVLYKLFYQTAFTTHPVRFPIIGYREPFDRLTREDIVTYYKTHYTPENTIVAVAGDINTQRAIEQVTQAFGSWSRRSAATPALPDEPRQVTPRNASVEKDVSQTYLMMGWHTIPLQHPDLYALDTLAQIIGGGESSRLVRELREKSNIATSISAYSSTPNYNAGVFAIRATMPPRNAGKVTNGVWSQIGRIWRDGVTAEELKRAQRQIEASFVFNSTNVEEQAEQMAYDYLGTGDPNYSRSYVARIQGVTAQQVQAAARKYLTREGVTTAWVRPRTAAVPASTRSAARKPVAAPPKMVTLSNGMRLIVRENRATPTVSIVAYGAGGTRLEPRNKAGVAAAFAQMLTRGTDKRNAEQIASTVDALGGSLDGFSGYNAWGVTSQWLSRDWRSGLSLVKEALLDSTFPEEELARVKQQLVAGIQQQQDDPMSAASLLLRRTYFGNHPYGRSSLGTLASIKAITREDVVKYWQSVLLPRSIVLAVYGDISAEEVRRAAEHSFRNFNRAGKLPAPPAPAPQLAKRAVQIQEKPGLAQAVLFYGYPGITVRNTDRYAIDVLDAALSGANLPGGRLHARLRDNQLVYVVHAFEQPGVDPGMFVIYAATTRPQIETVRGIIEEEVNRARNADISPEELTRAKTMAISSQAIESQTNMAQAQQAASDELFGVGYTNSSQYEQRINAVTLEEVRRVAQKYLRPEGGALAIVQPAATAGTGENSTRNGS